MIQCSRLNPPCRQSKRLHSGAPPVSRKTTLRLSSLYSEGRGLVPLIMTVGMHPFAPHVLPAWHGNVSGKKHFSVGVLMNSGSLSSSSAFLTPPRPSRWAMPCGSQPVPQPQGRSEGRGFVRRHSRAGLGAPCRFCLAASTAGFDRSVLQCPKTPALQQRYSGRETTSTALLSPAYKRFFLSVAVQPEQICLYSVHVQSRPALKQSLVYFLKKHSQVSDLVLLLSLFQHPFLSWSA